MKMVGINHVEVECLVNTGADVSILRKYIFNKIPNFDHLGPMDATGKQYKYIFAMVDSFTKFIWLSPTKTTSCEETLKKFGNPVRIVSDRGSAFTANSCTFGAQPEFPVEMVKFKG